MCWIKQLILSWFCMLFKISNFCTIGLWVLLQCASTIENPLHFHDTVHVAHCMLFIYPTSVIRIKFPVPLRQLLLLLCTMAICKNLKQCFAQK